MNINVLDFLTATKEDILADKNSLYVDYNSLYKLYHSRDKCVEPMMKKNWISIIKSIHSSAPPSIVRMTQLKYMCDILNKNPCDFIDSVFQFEYDAEHMINVDTVCDQPKQN